jgi:transposase
VREGPIRRRFSAEYKQRILAEADVCSQSGQVGALLRREGLYSSLLSTWRRQREAAVAEGLAPRKRGRKPSRDPQAERIARLERENARLKRDIEEAKIIIDIQKKTSQLLGIKLTDVSDHEKILYGEPNE